MAGSGWNAVMDCLLAHKLTVGEHRLALAIARLTIGWKKPSGAYLGRALIRDTAGLDGRAYQRARDGLVEKGILAVTGGGVGRGNRAYYMLVPLAEKADEERPIPQSEKADAQRPKLVGHKRPLSDTKKAALQRPRRVKTGKERTSGTDVLNDLRRQAFEAYASTGGSLRLEKERGALARSVTSLANGGTPHDDILTAARDLGRTRDFPGLLKQRVAEINAVGGYCRWEGLDRQALTPYQLSQCACRRCREWLVALSPSMQANA